MGRPTHAPALHTSPFVQAEPSSHGFVFGAFTHPVPGSQLSSVHAFESSQLGGVPGSQRPVVGLQVSRPSQASLLEQGTGVATQAPATQASPVVQMFPSSQVFVSLFVKTHPT